MLVPAHPLHPDRSSNRERADRSALAVVDVCGTSAERARAFVVDNAHTALVVRAGPLAEQHVRRRLDRGRDLRARHAVAVLDVAVDDRAVLRDVGHCDVRADRSVHLVVVLERSAPGLGSRGHRGVDAAHLARQTWRRRPLRRDARRRLSRRVEPTHTGPDVPDRIDLRWLRPRHLQLSGRLDRVVLLWCDDREVVADVDDLDVRQVLDRLRVNCERYRVDAVAVGALPARTNDTTMEHARDAYVRGICLLTAHDLRDVVPIRTGDADDLVLARMLRRCDTRVQRRRRELDVERLPAEQLSVRDRLAAAGDGALADAELRRRHAEVRRRHGEERLLRFGCRSSDQRSAL